jgi:integration host factor subunit alpha
MKKSLIAGEGVMISGFGKWSVEFKHARRGRNPQTGVPMVLDARKVVTWKYSPVLKEAVNGNRKGLESEE